MQREGLGNRYLIEHDIYDLETKKNWDTICPVHVRIGQDSIIADFCYLLSNFKDW